MPHQPVLETGALPVELPPHLNELAPRRGIEPRSLRVKPGALTLSAIADLWI